MPKRGRRPPPPRRKKRKFQTTTDAKERRRLYRVIRGQVYSALHAHEKQWFGERLTAVRRNFIAQSITKRVYGEVSRLPSMGKVGAPQTPATDARSGFVLTGSWVGGAIRLVRSWSVRP